MSINKEIGDNLLKLVEVFIERDNKAHNYGTDTKLHFSEIHMIVFIYENPEMHISQIARELNITRGAVSQTVNRLEKKGFLRKLPSEENKSIIKLILTNKGITAYESHEDDKYKYFKRVESLLKECSQAEKEIVYNFILGVKNKMEKL